MTTVLEGQTLGKYRILEPLGRGGMARVYRGYHPQLDRYVAIKVLRSDLAEEEEFLVRFRREAQAVAALRHPNIVQVFDFDVQGEIYYMVMELLEGDTLKMRLHDYRVRGEKMDLGEIVRTLLDVLDGLAYAHSEGMIHRDIKPANILLTRRGQAVVADFGIAHIVGGTRHTMSGALMGTLNYMAPEQGLESRCDARSDIYSLGIVLYEMLTQRTPFEADTPLAVLMKHVNDPLPLPRKINPAVPEPFERVVLKALSKRPDDRYQSAAEMAQALREAAEEAGIELPQRISLPLSFSTQEAPAESVAVFSGPARRRIADAEFAEDDTDESLGQRLAASGAESGQLKQAGKELLGAVGGVAQVAMSKATKALRKATAEIDRIPGRAEAGGAPAEDLAESPALAEAEVRSEPLDQPEEALGIAAAPAVSGRPERRRGSVGLAILSLPGLLVVSNLCMITGATMLNYWQIYDRGWPIQILLVGWGLCIIMYVASSLWMLIPTGIVLGTGAIMAYCSLTGNWEHWNFLWLVEVWIAVISIGLPIFLARHRSLARQLSRTLAVLLSLVAISWIGLVGMGLGLWTLITELRDLIL